MHVCFSKIFNYFLILIRVYSTLSISKYKHEWISYFSGMTAGASATAVGHPFDTVRIVMQTSSRPHVTPAQVITVCVVR